MTTRSYLILSGGMLLAGLLFYSLYNELVIIKFPTKGSSQLMEQSSASRKRIKLYYWAKGTMQSDDAEILYSTNSMKTAEDVITRWLSLLHEEELLPKKVGLQSVMIDKTGNELFISFDRVPFPSNLSTYTKLMWIEALLKTIKNATIPVKTVRFFLHHRVLPDSHLDFSPSWVIAGYSN